MKQFMSKIYAEGTINQHIWVSTQSGAKTPKIALKDPHPPTPSPKAGEGEPEYKSKSLAPSPLVGEGWGEG
jgi:hypothetical protein